MQILGVIFQLSHLNTIAAHLFQSKLVCSLLCDNFKHTDSIYLCPVVLPLGIKQEQFCKPLLS